MSQFFNPYLKVDQHGSKLPHWQQGEAFVFVTYRLADSLPVELLRTWKAEREVWLAKHPLPWDQQTKANYNERFTARMDHWLDQGRGSCLLKQVETRKLVVSALIHFDRKRYQMVSFVVMPNHVHALFQPLAGNLLEDIIHSWKSFSSKEIKKLTGYSDDVWMSGYWDRLIRNRQHFDRCVRYIHENPIKAKLSEQAFTHYEDLSVI
ncbi:MAG: REP-associated tyrosine transposase [Lentimonas sp.]